MAAGHPPLQTPDRRLDHPQDTSLTKVFVGGLAWETQRDAMRRYFEQYGEILEAVVITDKSTGRSKGYGFVTFRDPESARKACQDAMPVIDGRRANCNLASLGGHNRARPSYSFARGNGLQAMAAIPAPGGAIYMGAPVYVQQGNYAFQYGLPYHNYGYSYSPELVYQPGMTNTYGGMQYPQVLSGSVAIGNAPMYTCMQISQPSSPGIPVQHPQVLQYGATPTVTNPHQQQYGLQPLAPSITYSGATLGYPPFYTVGSPMLSSPSPPVFAVQHQQFSQAHKSEKP